MLAVEAAPRISSTVKPPPVSLAPGVNVMVRLPVAATCVLRIKMPHRLAVEYVALMTLAYAPPALSAILPLERAPLAAYMTMTQSPAWARTVTCFCPELEFQIEYP